MAQWLIVLLEVREYPEEESEAIERRGSWIAVPASVDNTNRRVCTTVPYLSSFALTSSISPAVFGDTLSEPRLIVPIVVVALVLVGGGLYVLLRSRGASEEPPQEG